MTAVTCGNTEVCESLLALKANAMLRNDEGHTALDCAEMIGADPAVIALLRDAASSPALPSVARSAAGCFGASQDDAA